MTRVLLFCLLALSAASTHALEIVIPIAGRTPGANATLWRTDLVITNLTAEYASLPLQIEFGDATVETSIRVGETIELEDVIRTRFGLENAAGYLIVRAAPPDAQLFAFAEIYNESAAGRFGQQVPGVPRTALATESIVGGLSTAIGVRTNLGIANPNPETATVELHTWTENGRQPYTIITVAPMSVRQIPVLTGTAQLDRFGVVVTASEPVAAYASVIRNDTGDATFIPAVTRRPSSDFVVTPVCENPAPLELNPSHAAPGYIVLYRQGTDAVTTTAALAEKYDFTPLDVFEHVPAFYAELTPQMIAGLRCESVVVVVEQNQFAIIPTR
ncbi:MAG TPA: DUF5719 family protein [Thermoanaerobaculia bacterium]|nr:DUF5719 family protein [Thermoanaerobaculia bacterium]